VNEHEIHVAVIHHQQARGAPGLLYLHLANGEKLEVLERWGLLERPRELRRQRCQEQDAVK
jgi:hypothetical protein